MISNYDLKERSKILEWLVEYGARWLEYDLGENFVSEDIWLHIEQNRDQWDR